jgi:hypothetical protein
LKCKGIHPSNDLTWTLYLSGSAHAKLWQFLTATDGFALEHWLQSTFGLNIDEAALIIAFLTLLVAVPAAVPPVRASLGRAARRLSLWSGTTRRHYARWFTSQNGKLRNIYLNRIEELDLGQTYVSLAFIEPGGLNEQRVQATNVLADSDYAHILIIGDPGTGKSTLLAAYGVGILQRKSLSGRSDLKFIAQSSETPILVRLRQFAAHADGPASLARYITNDILRRQAGVPSASDFLRRLLRDRKCLVLLDGLDEVPDSRYAAVKDAIAEFVEDQQTGVARVILSCRRQNFLRIQTDWIPTFCDRSHVLAPLRDADIFMFLIKRQRDFTAPRTPEAFFTAIRNSGSIDLHRVPLILTISLGLYLQLVAYEIPRSIAKFYEEMINGLLIRHDFRGDQAGSTNKYNAEDKYRFLREFAFAMAQRPDRFEDFTFAEIVGFAAAMVPKMSYVQSSESESFVREIIDRSGLLTRISDEDEYIFAHRSIQEYLIAIQLTRDPAEGARFLLSRAADSAWRQVALFFAALDHNSVNSFLTELGGVNLELAGYCLAAAGPVTEEVAEPILERLADSILDGNAVAESLSALVRVTGGQRGAIQDLAVTTLTKVLMSVLGRADLISALGDPESALRLLQALAETGSAQIAATVPTMLGAISLDDERAVGVLWRCLAAEGMEQEDSSKVIVNRLLTMAMQERGLAELQRQPAYTPSFVTDEVRRKVYPFREGVDDASNLVTLLAWADHLDVTPDSPNVYLTAIREDSRAFASVERDRHRTLAIRPFAPARVMAISVPIIALTFVVIRMIINWRTVEIHGNWWLSAGLWIAPPTIAAAFAIAIAQLSTERYRRKFGRTIIQRALTKNDISGLAVYPFRIVSAYYISTERSNANANAFFYLIDNYFFACGLDGDFDLTNDLRKNNDLLGISQLISLPCAIAVDVLSANLPIATIVLLSGAATWLTYWFPATWNCAKGSVMYLKRPNRYVSVYEDVRSRHWVETDGSRPA